MNIELLLNSMRSAHTAGEDLWVVHYACENFYTVRDRPVGVSCVCFREAFRSKEVSFSVIDQHHDQADYRERSMLEQVFQFLSKQQGATLLHWNMNRADYGLRALASRLAHLRRDDFTFERPDDRTFDVDELVKERYGDDYASHPKLKQLADLNAFRFQHFLSGPELADRYDSGQHGDLRRATLDKTKAIAFLYKRMLEGKLVTKTSGALLTFASAQLDAARVVTALGDRIVPVSRQLRRRHDNRATLQIKDEYDFQDLFHAMLRVFFDDVRAEEWVPSYAGGASRIDFLVPEPSIAIELKHSRKSMSQRELGEQLLVDIARYRTHPGVQRLVCLVLDLEGHLANPRGLARDLIAELDFPVTLRIYER